MRVLVLLLLPVAVAGCQAAAAGGRPSQALIEYCLNRIDRATPPGPDAAEAERFGYDFCIQENRRGL
ncbi:hypothetical protein JQC91_05550 [Jannaschia sp. Os4]|uniref:hypothetical protein n=1 Tax=Jannaschia sp. Os4 TaxID=2807617 RepID=UPI00193A32EE|nr:hypothetical protein [Jannaschia sp. Os4]MBM2575765.1 hypothetical protein [Jannaschia sp. Os4]